VTKLLRGLKRALVAFLLIAILTLNCLVSDGYVEQSRASHQASSSSFLEIPYASSDKAFATFQQLKGELRDRQPVIADTWTRVMGKLESEFTVGSRLTFLTSDLFENISHYSAFNANLPAPIIDHRIVSAAESLSSELARSQNKTVQRFGSTSRSVSFRAVDLRNEPGLENAMFLSTGRDQTILNRYFRRPSEDAPASLSRLKDVSDRLVFVDSSLGHPYYESDDAASLYQVEPDPFVEGQTMSAVGRYLLFRVVGGSKCVRITTWLSSTIRGDGEVRLPPAKVLGVNEAPFPFEGRGSARAATPCIEPRHVAGGDYVLLDMGIEGRPIRTKRVGIMSWYGKGILFDPRHIVAFARDFSVLPAKATSSAPSSVDTFPDGLTNEHLFYSGLYEDGWASGNFWLDLVSRGKPNLRLKGQIPEIDEASFATILRISIDGRLVKSTRIAVGNFDVSVNLGSSYVARRVQFAFDRTQRLPNGDGRPVSALLSFVGFQ
jgi:hypothetical protein